MTIAAAAPRTRRMAIAIFGLLLIAASAPAQQIDCSESEILGQMHAKEEPFLIPFLIGAAAAIAGGAMASSLIVSSSAVTQGMSLYSAALTGATLGAFYPLAAAVVYSAVSVPAPLNPDPAVVNYECFTKGYKQAAWAPRAVYAFLGGVVGTAAVFGVASIIALQVYGPW